MHFKERSCQHLNLVEDWHEGFEVCTSCGLVLSQLFMNQMQKSETSEQNLKDEKNVSLEEIRNLLDRIHISTCFAAKIEAYLKENFTTKSNQALVYSTFKILNELSIPISLKEISLASNLSKKILHKVQSNNEVVHVDFSNVMEKYARLLNLSYETITLIKERIINSPNSGHNPNSVIAATIYQICKITEQPISMKKISLVTQVSCVSIQRYNKFCKTPR